MMAKKRLQKFFAVFLAVCMLTGILPTAALAAGETVYTDKETAKEATGVTADKTVTDNGDGTYTIELSVKGTSSQSSTTTDLPADVVLVIDSSGSMDYCGGELVKTPTGLGYRCQRCGEWYSLLTDGSKYCEATGTSEDRMYYAKEAAKQFVDGMLDGDSQIRVGLADFSGRNHFTVALTQDAEGLKDKIDSNDLNADHGDGTNYTAGLKAAKTILDNGKNENKFIVFLSDGEPEQSWGISGPVDGKAVSQQLIDSGVTIMTVGIDVNSGAEDSLKAISSTGKDGQKLYTAAASDALGTILDQLHQTIQETINAGKNAVMTDVVNTEYFEVVEAPTELEGQDGTLTWNIGDIGAEEQKVSFTIKLKENTDPSGVIKTNDSVSLEFDSTKVGGPVEFTTDAIGSPEIDFGYTVAYDLAGGTGAVGVSYDAVKVNSNESITTAAAPAKEDFVFTGWKNQNGMTYAAGAALTVTENVTLTAQWAADINHNNQPDDEETKYTITYDRGIAPEGTAVPAQVTNVLSGIEQTRSSAVPTWAGHTFIGWQASANVTDLNETTGKFTMPASNVTFTAQWETNTSTITVEVENGTADPTGPITVEYGEDQTITFTANQGYALDTVTVDNETASLTGSSYTFNAVTENHSIRVVYAEDTNGNGEPDYREDKYTITYDPGDAGENAAGMPSAESDVLSGIEKSRSDAVPTWAGHTFTGWQASANVTDLDDTTGTFMMPASNVTFTATWAEVPTTYDGTYTVQYYKDGTPDESSEVNATAAIGEPLPVDTDAINITDKYGDTYTLDKIEVNDEVVTALPETITNGGVIKVYYAEDTNGDDIPDYKEFTLTFDANGGAWNEEATQIQKLAPAGTMVQTLVPDDPERDGYTFTGWYADAACTESVGAILSFLRLNADYTLYAGWEESGTGPVGPVDPDPVDPTSVAYSICQHFIGRDGEEVGGTNVDGLRAPVDTVIAELIADKTQDQTYDGANYIYADDETIVLDANDKTKTLEDALAEGDAIDLYYYLDEWDENGGTTGGDGIPDMYQALIEYKAMSGGSVDPQTQVVTLVDDETGEYIDETSVTASSTAEANEGYEFIGWEKSDGEKADEAELNLELTVSAGETYTFTAYFKNADPDAPTEDEIIDAFEKSGSTITVFCNRTDEHEAETYDLLEGTFTVEKVDDITYTVTVKADKYVETYGGHSIDGRDEATFEVVRASGEWIMNETDLEFEVMCKVTITFNGNGGTVRGDASKSVGRGDAVGTLPSASRSGYYDFVGWFTAATGGDRVTTATIFDEDTTLYAHWRYDRPRDDDDDDDDDPPRRDDDDDTTILDEEVPLAGDLNLNKEDHFAYIKGYADGTVRPNNYITRAQVATIFYRLLTEETRAIYFADVNNYSDVSADYWANKAISTLSNAGVITGFQDGTFRPNAYISRAQFAAIAARFSVVQEGLPNLFSDVPEDYWAKDEIAYASYLGWIDGYADGTFRPKNNITRAAAMKLINNVLERRVDEEGLLANATQWNDNNPSDWHYFVVLEATNSHDYDRRVKDELMENWTALNADPVWDE